MTTASMAAVAGAWSRAVGSVRAVEAARNAAQAIACGESLLATFVAIIAHRRNHPATYGSEWASVSSEQASIMATCAVAAWERGGRATEVEA